MAIGYGLWVNLIQPAEPHLGGGILPNLRGVRQMDELRGLVRSLGVSRTKLGPI
jgi:hypothetical protein